MKYDSTYQSYDDIEHILGSLNQSNQLTRISKSFIKRILDELLSFSKEFYYKLKGVIKVMILKALPLVHGIVKKLNLYLNEFND